jgi:hypothetical protein
MVARLLGVTPEKLRAKNESLKFYLSRLDGPTTLTIMLF